GLGVVEVVERHVAHPLGGHHHDVGAGRRAVGEVEPDLDARVVGTGVEQAQALVTREGRVLARAVRRDPAVADRPARRPDLGATCRGARRAHTLIDDLARTPPSHPTSDPVVYDERSDSSQSTGSAISSGRASRPSGTSRSICARVASTSSAGTLAHMSGVSVGPGTIAFTRTPWRA